VEEWDEHVVTDRMYVRKCIRSIGKSFMRVARQKVHLYDTAASFTVNESVLCCGDVKLQKSSNRMMSAVHSI